MSFAHQGIELKPLIGAGPTAPPQRPNPLVAERNSKDSPTPVIARPVLLTKNAANILVRIERAMDDARSALPPMSVSAIGGGDAPVAETNGALASAREPGAVRGN